MAFEERIYNCARALVLNVVNDMMELQKGRLTQSDSLKGVIAFSVSMYGIQTEYLFTVTAVSNGCVVKIETPGEEENDKKAVFRMFALLESLMDGQMKGE